MVVTLRQYDTVSDFLEVALSPVPDTGLRNASRDSGSFMDHSWDFGVGWQGAVELCTTGWPEGREAVERFTHKLKTVMEGKLRLPEIRFGEEGLELDVDRYQQGLPDAVFNIVEGDQEIDARPPRIITIVINSAASASVDSKVLEMRGAAVVALADLLEMSQVRVNIDLVSSTKSYGADRLETRVRVKHSDYPMQLDALAFQLVHPAAFRRIMFSDWEHMSRELRQKHGIYSGYGTPANTDEKGDLYLGSLTGYSRDEWSEEAALKWITEQLEAQGVEVAHDD